MIKEVGYACINESLKPKTFKSCRLKSVITHGIGYLRERMIHNLNFVFEILKWNADQGIYMYRVSSDLFPLVTHPELLKQYDWRWYEDDEILGLLEKIKTLVIDYNMRLSMHPDQYTVLNSNREEVIHASIQYLAYHGKLLSYMGGKDMIIHVGGVYGNKKAAMDRFIKTYKVLNSEIKAYLRLENDDKSYAIEEVLEISDKTGVPVVFDYHHHRCLSGTEPTDELIERINATWKEARPKIHLSSGKTHEKDRSHADYISIEDCRALIKLYLQWDVDLMIEAKKKELATLAVITCIKNSS